MRQIVTTLAEGEQGRRARVAHAIDDFVAKAKRLHVRKIILYGSTARGEDREGSDVDLLLIGDRNERSKIAYIETEIDLKYGVPLVSMVRDSDSANTPFMREVLANGRVLYERGVGV